MLARVLLLDLDGTLVDPAEGILEGCRRGLAGVGRPDLGGGDLRWMIGPPLRESFGRLLGDPALAEAAVGHYRAYYGEEGIFRATPYSGIHAALAALRGEGWRMQLCTSKPHPFARRVVDRFGFAEFLDGVYGAELDGRFDDKRLLMRHLLEAERLDPGRCVMVGDRRFDVEAAAVNGLPCVGALWGYGGREELEAAGVVALCGEPGELPAAVRRLSPA